MKTRIVLIMYLLYLCSTGSSAQGADPFFDSGSKPTADELRESLREARNLARDRPRVRPAELNSHDIDSIILQKLHYSLQADPLSFQASTGFSDSEVILLASRLSDFTNVVLQQQNFAIDDMCKVWNSSVLEVETLIDNTLDAFDSSRTNRSPVIYQVMQELMIDIENQVEAEKFDNFSEIMNVSRRDLAGKSIYTFAQNARIMGDPETTLKYHCEEVR